MSKQTCSQCNAEVGLLQQVKMRDGNYLCRACANNTHPLFAPASERSLAVYEAHLKQLEQGKILYEKLFIPRKKPADKSMKLKKLGGGMIVAKDIGLLAIVQKRGVILFWGGTPYYMVFRLADLFKYEYSQERDLALGSKAKSEVKHYLNFAFWDTTGLDEFKVKMASESACTSAEKYFNECFGLNRKVKHIAGTLKGHIQDVKMAAQGLKTILSKDATDEDKVRGAEQLTQAAKNELYGDRTELIAKADAAMKQL